MKLPKINYIKITSYIVGIIILALIGVYLRVNGDVLVFAITNPDDVRLVKVVRTHWEKTADIEVLEQLSVIKK